MYLSYRLFSTLSESSVYLRDPHILYFFNSLAKEVGGITNITYDRPDSGLYRCQADFSCEGLVLNQKGEAPTKLQARKEAVRKVLLSLPSGLNTIQAKTRNSLIKKIYSDLKIEVPSVSAENGAFFTEVQGTRFQGTCTESVLETFVEHLSAEAEKPGSEGEPGAASPTKSKKTPKVEEELVQEPRPSPETLAFHTTWGHEVVKQYKIQEVKKLEKIGHFFQTDLSWSFLINGERQEEVTSGIASARKFSAGLAYLKMLAKLGFPTSSDVALWGRLDEIRKDLKIKADATGLQKFMSLLKELPAAFWFFLPEVFDSLNEGYRVQLLDFLEALLVGQPGISPDIYSKLLQSAVESLLGERLISKVASLRLGADFFESSKEKKYFQHFTKALALERFATIKDVQESPDTFLHQGKKIMAELPVLLLQTSSELDLAKGDLVLVEGPLGRFLGKTKKCDDTNLTLTMGKDAPPAFYRADQYDLAVVGGESGHIRMTKALEFMCRPRSGVKLEKPGMAESSVLLNLLLREKHVSNPIEKRTTNADLSQAQQDSVNLALNNPITIIQGPPGTGKTICAAEIASIWASEGDKILAAADSNSAADNLEAVFLKAQLDVLRVGRGAERTEAGIPKSLVQFARRHKLQGLAKVIAYPSDPFYRKKLLKEAMSKAKIVVTTLVGSGHHAFEDHRFKRVIVDEAAQAIEPSSLIPLILGCEKLVLIGDHKQLPPTVLCNERSLYLSLFERLLKVGFPFIMLDQQFRMHHSIANFVSKEVYGNKLQSCAGKRMPIKGVPLPNPESHVLFVDCKSGESKVGNSFVNKGEAERLIKLLKKISLPMEKIGIITPYTAQKTYLQDRVAGIPVDTVDGYQGMEKDLILVSTVRSQTFGFIDDPRRANVAITRARNQLVVLGNKSLLTSRENIWKRFIEYAEALNSSIV